MYRLDASDTFLLFYLFAAKILPALVTYFADKCFSVKIKFKSLSVLSANVQNVSVKVAGVEISVGEIALRTKYLNSDYKKPLCFDLEDVKITRTHDDAQERPNVGEGCEKSTAKANSNDGDAKTAERAEWVDGFRRYVRKLLPPFAMMTLKLLQVRIKNLSTTVVNHESGPVTTLSIPVANLLFDRHVARERRSLLILLALQHIKSEFVAYNKQTPSRRPSHACLAEISLDITLETELIWARGSLDFESQHVSVSDVRVTFYGGLFDMIEHATLHSRSGTAPTARDESVRVATKSEHRLERLIDRLTPHVASFHAEQIEVKSLSKESSYHYHLLLHTVDARANLRRPDGTSSARGELSNLRIHTPAHEVLHLKDATAEMRASDTHVIRSTLTVDTLDAVYSHEDHFGWFVKIVKAGMNSTRREMILDAIELGNQKMMKLYRSALVRDLFARITLNCCVELRNATLVLELDDEISSVSASKLKLQVSQSEKLREAAYENHAMHLLFANRHWHVDVTSEGSLRWFMGSRHPPDGDNKSAYVRGCALYLGNALVRVASHREDFGVSLRVNTLRAEYSGKLTRFAVQSARSFRAFVNLFSQLRRKKQQQQQQRDEVDDGVRQSRKSLPSIEELLRRVCFTLRVVDCSCFLLNRHDVCTFVSLSNVTSEDNFNYRLDTLSVATIDFRKHDEVRLSELEEIATTYISTCLLKVKLELAEQQPQLCVDFAEKLECSWNAHFLRHSLSLVRDFRRFRQALEDALEVERVSKPLLSTSLPVGLDIKKLRNIRVKHADVNVDKLILLINELSGENLFFYNYFH